MASGRLIIPIVEPILLQSGLPDSGATLSVYQNGATSGTLASLFADSGLTTPIANPQTSNAAGRFYDQTTVIWADSSMAYGAVVALTDGSTLTYPNLYTLGAATNISGLAPINSPNFTGVPTAPTPALNDDSDKIATTAYVQGQGYAPLNSPAFTGTPTAPTAAHGTDTTQVATTAFVQAAISGSSAFFESGEINISAGTAATNIPHGLGVVPTRVQGYIRCKLTDHGYPVGAEVPINIDSGFHDSDVRSEGAVAFAVDSTNVGYSMGIDGLTCLAVSPAGQLMSQGSAPSSPNWVFIIRAWA